MVKRAGRRQSTNVEDGRGAAAVAGGGVIIMLLRLIVGRFGKVTSVAEQKQFFQDHIEPWAIHFFADLEASKTSVFYGAVGALGRQFMEIEAEAFDMLPN